MVLEPFEVGVTNQVLSTYNVTEESVHQTRIDKKMDTRSEQPDLSKIEVKIIKQPAANRLRFR